MVIGRLKLPMELWCGSDGASFASKLAVCPITSTPPLTGLKPAYDENCQGIKLSFGHKIEHLLLLLTCCGECSDQRISAALFYALRAILRDSDFLYFNYKCCSSLIIVNVGVPMTKTGKNLAFWLTNRLSYARCHSEINHLLLI